MSNQNRKTEAEKAIEKAKQIANEYYDGLKVHRKPAGEEEREALAKALNVIATEVQSPKRNIDQIIRKAKGEKFPAALDSKQPHIICQLNKEQRGNMKKQDKNEGDGREGIE